MICPNKNTKFYKSLVEDFGQEDAYRIAFKSIQPDFDVWYGAGKRDANGNPILDGTKITNEEGIVYPLERMLYTTEEERQLWKEGELNNWESPTGIPSKLSKSQWVQVRTNKFREWYGDWVNNPSKLLDTKTQEPIVTDLDGTKVFVRTVSTPDLSTDIKAAESVNGIFPIGKRSVYQSTQELTAAEREQSWLNKAEHLKQIFFQKGLDIEIIIDPTLEENANAEYLGNGAGIIRVNPNKVFKDTLPHEFSHFYIELLGGVKNPLVKKAIAQAKKARPDIWKTIQQKYDYLSKEDLDKELLVTAMGIEASLLYTDEGELQRWKFLLNTLWRWLADKLGRERNFAKDLYIDMAGDKWDEMVDNANLREGHVMKSVLDQIELDNQDIVLEEEEHVYRNAEDPTKGYTGVTSFTEDFSSKWGIREGNDKSPARQAAEKTFGKTPLDQKIWITLNGEKLEVDIDQLTDLKNIRYKTGMASGKVAHLLMERYVKVQNGESVEVIDEEIRKTAAEKPNKQEEVDITRWDWLENAAPTIFEKLGINALNVDVPPNRKDKIKAEVTLHDDELGLATKADSIVEHADGTITMVDYKGGYYFLDDISDQTKILSYGDGELYPSHFDTKLNIARLEVMTRALMLKKQQPNIRFRKLVVIHLDKLGTKKYEVPMKATLKLLEGYYKKNDPELYKKLNKDGLFSVGNYLATVSEFTEATAYDGMDREEIIEDMQDELDRLTAKPKKDADTQARIEELTMQLLRAKSEKDTEFNLNDESDINWVKRWLGSKYTVKNKFIQSWFKDFLDPAAQEMRNEIDIIQSEHKKVLIPLMQQYYKGKGKTFSYKYLESEIDKIGAAVGGLAGMMIGGGPGAAAGATLLGLIGNVQNLSIDTHELYKFMYKQSEDVHKKGLYLATDTKDMTLAEKAYHKFFKETIAREYELTMGKKVYVQDLDQYKTLGEVLGNPLKLDEDFLPRVPISDSEIMERHGFKKATSEAFKRQKDTYIKAHKKEVTSYNERHTHGVHLKYMGSTQIISEGNHTENAELMFNKFVHNMVAKRHLDVVYAVGEGINGLLSAKEHGKDFKNTISFLEDQMKIQILGRDRRDIDKGFKIRVPDFDFRTGKFIPNSYKFIEVGRFLISMKSFTSAITMWLKPIGGFMNTMLIVAQNVKEATKGSLVKRFGVEFEDIDFTLSDLIKSQKAIAQYWTDHFAGKAEQNKLHLMLKKWDFLPSNFDYVTSQTKLYSGKTRWFNQSNFFVFHGLGEEWGQMTLLVAQLMRKKHNDISYWDHYQVENGDLAWKGGKRFDRAEAKLVDSDSGKRGVYGLEPEEVTRLKRVTQRIHGGYRHEEKVALELTALGKWALQFKKYLPAVIENALIGKYEDVTLGAWQKRPDEDTYDWVARINEGRIQLMGKWVAATISQKLGSGQFLTDYTWDELDPEQKKNIMDFWVSWTYWASLTMGLGLYFDDDDDNPWRLRYETKIQDLTQSWNPLDFGKAIKEPTVVIPRLYKIGEAAADFFLKGVLQGKRVKSGPNKGRLIGETSFRKGLPFVTTTEELYRFGLLDPITQR
jgi:hypothetical protein